MTDLKHSCSRYNAHPPRHRLGRARRVAAGRGATLNATTGQVTLTLALTACVASTASQVVAGQGPPAPSPSAVADSRAVAETHRSRTLAALLEEFGTTTPENARINSRAISNLFFDGNPLMRLVTSGDFEPLQKSANPITKFEADAIASFKAGGPGFFARLDRVGPRWVWCEAVALNNGAFLEGGDLDPDVCQTCHPSFPADNTVLVGSLNHCDVVRE